MQKQINTSKTTNNKDIKQLPKSMCFGCVVCYLIFVVCCLLFVVRCLCLLFVVRCLLFVACCLLFVVCCLLFVVCCLLFVVCCLLFDVCCLMFVVCCLLLVVCCLLITFFSNWSSSARGRSLSRTSVQIPSSLLRPLSRAPAPVPRVLLGPFSVLSSLVLSCFSLWKLKVMCIRFFLKFHFLEGEYISLSTRLALSLHNNIILLKTIRICLVCNLKKSFLKFQFRWLMSPHKVLKLGVSGPRAQPLTSRAPHLMAPGGAPAQS